MKPIKNINTIVVAQWLYIISTRYFANSHLVTLSPHLSPQIKYPNNKPYKISQRRIRIFKKSLLFIFTIINSKTYTDYLYNAASILNNSKSITRQYVIIADNINVFMLSYQLPHTLPQFVIDFRPLLI